MKALFADPEMIASLHNLHANVAVAIPDFTPERAKVVRLLNREQVPAVAWMLLPKEEGLYLNADNAAEAAARFTSFEQWTQANRLQWAAIGLDIEPNFAEFAMLKDHRWQLITTLLRRSMNGKRIARAQKAFAALIREIQARGYPVETYDMPYIPAERSAGSQVLDRLLGTVDVRGNQEYLMLYTSYARSVGAGMIWSLGPHAQAITIGSTDGTVVAGSGSSPLNWNEFSRDLIVASHFSQYIGVYNLEGCVRQGFLPRLEKMDWSESVTIPASAVVRAERLGMILRTVLWIVTNLMYFIVALLLLAAGLVWLWSIRKRRHGSSPIPLE